MSPRPPSRTQISWPQTNGEREDAVMRFPRSSDPELLDVIERYVKPTTNDTGRYLHLLHANFTRDDEPERRLFLQSLRSAAQAITDEELEVLLESEWRSRLTAPASPLPG